MVEDQALRASSRLEPHPIAQPGVKDRARLLRVRTLTYLTNHLIAHFPSFGLRRGWYRRVLGISVGPGSGVHLGCYVWFYGPGQIRGTVSRSAPTPGSTAIARWTFAAA